MSCVPFLYPFSTLWALAHRPESTHTELILNKHGQPIDRPTEGRNRRQTIANAWDRLYKRVSKDQRFRNLSFGKLRKTAGSLNNRAQFSCTSRIVDI